MLFLCKGYNEYRIDVQKLREKAQCEEVGNVMSADDEHSVAQMARFLYGVLGKRKRFLVYYSMCVKSLES